MCHSPGPLPRVIPQGQVHGVLLGQCGCNWYQLHPIMMMMIIIIIIIIIIILIIIIIIIIIVTIMIILIHAES